MDRCSSPAYAVYVLIREGGTRLGAFVFDKIQLNVLKGLSAMGFSIPEIISKWSGRMREAAMDSTCA